jgi:hypothetical protein
VFLLRQLRWAAMALLGVEQDRTHPELSVRHVSENQWFKDEGSSRSGAMPTRGGKSELAAAVIAANIKSKMTIRKAGGVQCAVSHPHDARHGSMCVDVRNG